MFPEQMGTGSRGHISLAQLNCASSMGPSAVFLFTVVQTYCNYSSNSMVIPSLSHPFPFPFLPSLLIYFFPVAFCISSPPPAFLFPSPSLCRPLSGGLPPAAGGGSCGRAASRSERRGGAGRRHRLSLPLPFSSPRRDPAPGQSRSGHSAAPPALPPCPGAALPPVRCREYRPPPSPGGPPGVPAAQQGCLRAVPTAVLAEGGDGTAAPERSTRSRHGACAPRGQRRSRRPPGSVSPMLAELRPRCRSR